jgi:single-strand DNA-binding protein
MLNTTTTTFAGNLAGDPQLRYTTNGKPVAEARVLVNKRTQNDAGEWTDGEPTGHTIKVWGPAAENFAAHAAKGTRVLVTGRVDTDTWTDKDTSEKRTAQVVIVDEIAESYAWRKPEQPQR